MTIQNFFLDLIAARQRPRERYYNTPVEDQ
jgi:hypothetical protein